MSTDYQKFIILSTHRSGTNLLTSLLNSHRQIKMNGECFRPSYFDATLHHSFFIRILLTTYRNVLPIHFLQSYIYRPYPRGIRAVGFELFYTHNRKGWSKQTWQYIQNTSKIKIIHLQRKNLLRSYASLRIAEKTNLWNTANPKKITSITIELDYTACRQYFLATEAYRKFFDTYFQNHDCLSITYEDLVASRNRETKKILRFLNVPNQMLSTSLVKLDTRSLSDIVQNYAQLKRRFSKTKWASFFND